MDLSRETIRLSDAAEKKYKEFRDVQNPGWPVSGSRHAWYRVFGFEANEFSLPEGHGRFHFYASRDAATHAVAAVRALEFDSKDR